ncbi:MAG: hypothetical protein LBF17_04560 [Mediterranea sp.]|jgi:hypothetical protein|nr:hypothetical protein [Mediterranea sp.]
MKRQFRKPYSGAGNPGKRVSPGVFRLSGWLYVTFLQTFVTFSQVEVTNNKHNETKKHEEEL